MEKKKKKPHVPRGSHNEQLWAINPWSLFFLPSILCTIYKHYFSSYHMSGVILNDYKY